MAFVFLTVWLRKLPFSSEPILYSYLQIVGSLLLLHLCGKRHGAFPRHARPANADSCLWLCTSGVIETVATFNFYDILAGGASGQLRVPLAWMVSRTRSPSC